MFLFLVIQLSFFTRHGDDVYNYMKYLTEIGRFQTMIMFLSDKEENGMYLIFVLRVIFILLFILMKKVFIVYL